ncbi:uncharacterized protein LOC132314542 [Cornus florida]|uniref:uncharacterized protein LOC132314542 n=1 Tax=Cornus florida TaxID=4283 RepID=UPI0028992E8F|nr:uncharacterized protein LOC132314542 [Cornus florida]
MQLLQEFADVKVKHVYRSHNKEANDLAQIASSVRMPEGIIENLIRIKKKSLPSVKLREELSAEVFIIEVEEDIEENDWRTPIVGFLKNLDLKADKKLKIKALKFVMIDRDLFKKSIKDDLLLRFEIPESITTDRGLALIAKEVQAFAAEYGIKLLNSTLHFAQGNGQAESSNKTLKGIIEKMVEDNPRVWHELLSETLWAYKTSQRSSSGVTLFMLTYGHDAVLPIEVTVWSMRFALQNNLTSTEYNESMLIELKDLDEVRLRALDHIQVQKRRVARAYNKRVRAKTFGEGNLVWKTVLLIGVNDRKYGKWSPNWEGPFMVYKVLKGDAYHLQDLDGEIHPRPINGRYLKTYCSTMWETMENETKDS